MILTQGGILHAAKCLQTKLWTFLCILDPGTTEGPIKLPLYVYLSERPSVRPSVSPAFFSLVFSTAY